MPPTMIWTARAIQFSRTASFGNTSFFNGRFGWWKMMHWASSANGEQMRVQVAAVRRHAQAHEARPGLQQRIEQLLVQDARHRRRFGPFVRVSRAPRPPAAAR
jgi:hypothetical protein